MITEEFETKTTSPALAAPRMLTLLSVTALTILVKPNGTCSAAGCGSCCLTTLLPVKLANSQCYCYQQLFGDPAPVNMVLSGFFGGQVLMLQELLKVPWAKRALQSNALSLTGASSSSPPWLNSHSILHYKVAYFAPKTKPSFSKEYDWPDSLSGTLRFDHSITTATSLCWLREGAGRRACMLRTSPHFPGFSLRGNTHVLGAESLSVEQGKKRPAVSHSACQRLARPANHRLCQGS